MTTANDTRPPADGGAAPASPGAGAPVAGNMEFILDIPLEVTVELGRTKLLVHELLKLGQGSVIELTKLAGETLDVLANQKLIARLARLKPPEADIVIFGHSHLSCAVRLNGTLYFNPGAISASAVERSKEGPRIGRLTLRDDGGVEYEWREI